MLAVPLRWLVFPALPAEVTLHDQRRIRLMDLALDDNGHIDFTLVTTR